MTVCLTQFDNQESPEEGGMFQNRIPKGNELNAWREALRQAAEESTGKVAAEGE